MDTTSRVRKSLRARKDCVRPCGSSSVPSDGEPTVPAMDENPVLHVLYQLVCLSVVIATVMFKLPQMYIVYTTKSTEAISLPSNILELLAYSTMLTYQFAMDYPLETFAENLVQVIEDLALIVMMMYYRDELVLGTIPFFLVYFVFFVAVAKRWPPDWAMVCLIALTTPVLLWSKIDQLYEIISLGDAGKVSLVTWIIYVYCTGVRIFTTLAVTGDMPMLVNLTSSQVFNVAIVSAILYYNGIQL